MIEAYTQKTNTGDEYGYIYKRFPPTLFNYRVSKGWYYNMMDRLCVGVEFQWEIMQ